jgi:sugar phosphate isomerase/epimerase
MLRQTGEKDFWSAVQAVGAEGVEVGLSDHLDLPQLFHPAGKYSVATPEGIARLADDVKAAGKRIASFCLFNKMESRPDFEIKWCSQVARAAQALGIPAIRIDIVPAKMAKPDFLRLAVETMRRIIAETKDTGVAFAVENHGNTTNDPAFLTELFKGVDSERFGLTFDAANFYWFGHPLAKIYELCETLAPRVFHTHCKNIRYPASEREKKRPMGWKYAEYGCPVDEGDIDFGRIAGILHKAGYRNDFCVEDEFLGKLSAAETTRRLAKQIEFLKGVRAKVSA